MGVFIKTSPFSFLLAPTRICEKPLMASSSFNKTRKRMVHTPAVTPAVDLRYGNTPCCYCKKKATIKVVESESKMSKGKLYYSCSLWRCNFFGWLKPEEVIFKDREIFGDELKIQSSRVQQFYHSQNTTQTKATNMHSSTT